MRELRTPDLKPYWVIPNDNEMVTMRDAPPVNFWYIHMGLMGQTKRFVDGNHKGHVKNAIWDV